MIAIIDYGMGNLRSVAKGFEKTGVNVSITSDPKTVDEAPGVVLPGVGAFSDAMRNLRELGMVESIHRAVEEKKPFLGICLGMQLLFESSEEWGTWEGLGVFPGRVRRLPPGLKVPHMGWNTLSVQNPCRLLDGIPQNTAFYFVHSYYVEPVDNELTACTTEYGFEFTSVTARENVFGIQFHPEKSSAMGLRILQTFGGLVLKC